MTADDACHSYHTFPISPHFATYFFYHFTQNFGPNIKDSTGILNSVLTLIKRTNCGTMQLESKWKISAWSKTRVLEPYSSASTFFQFSPPHFGLWSQSACELTHTSENRCKVGLKQVERINSTSNPSLVLKFTSRGKQTYFNAIYSGKTFAVHACVFTQELVCLASCVYSRRSVTFSCVQSTTF